MSQSTAKYQQEPQTDCSSPCNRRSKSWRKPFLPLPANRPTPPIRPHPTHGIRPIHRPRQTHRFCPKWWNSAIASGAKVVIPLPTGWDSRPRCEHPVPWIDQAPEHFLQPTNKELQKFCKSSIQITCANRNITEAQTVIVYAWNENSENGASLIPSIGNGTYYVTALSQILPMSC
ncbi:hypothetical protein I4U23_017168 [Adineta vaga]|nr:hypothetical protein I4U23_017168 [Adineta vaga]